MTLLEECPIRDSCNRCLRATSKKSIRESYVGIGSECSSSGIGFISLSAGVDFRLLDAKFLCGFFLDGSAVELTEVMNDGLFLIVPVDLFKSAFIADVN